MGIIKERAKLNRAIRNAKTIFLMAHKNLDLDALGSQIGMYMLLKKKKKTIYIIIDDINHEMGVEKVLRELEGCINIIKSENIKEYLNPRKSKNLLIVLDTNKTELVQNKEVLDIVQNKIVIDHHEIGKTSIKNAIMINDNKISSTCEMIANLIEFYDVELESYYATILLSGIVLDTNNFTLNTTAETYYTAYFLASLGASAKKVQYLLKQDLAEYTERQKLFNEDWPFYTTTHNTPPALYGKDADVTNSFIANGAVIKGKVTNSIISREVSIEKGAEVKNSIVFTRAVVGKDVKLNHVLCDKSVTILNSKKLNGEEDDILVIAQGAKL